MTTSRLALVLVVLGLGASVGAQAQSQPEGVTWAISEFSGPSDWSARLPLLLTASLGDLGAHKLSEAEARARQERSLAQNRASLQSQASGLKIDLDRRRLEGGVSKADTSRSLKALADVEAKLSGLEIAPAEESLPLTPVWSQGRPGLPWPGEPAPLVAARAKATFVVSGEVRPVGPAFGVRVSVYSAWESRILVEWQGFFQPDEAAQVMAAAGDALRATLLGRDWARLSIRGPEGTRVRVGSQWYPLPWSSSGLEPGVHDLVVRGSDGSEQAKSVELLASQSLALDWEAPPVVPNLVLETSPTGALLYLDSRLLGPSPQVVERPVSTARIRVETPDAGTQAWEIGPETPSPFVMNLGPKPLVPDVPRAKDDFYLSLAAFSISLTSTAFAGAWNGEQAHLANAYATAGDLGGYNDSIEKYYLTGTLYVSGFVLTSGLFVWMMFELGEYLAAAQASLP